MLNNFEIIRDMLDFSNPDTYYFLQLLKRRKDNPDMDKDMVVIEDIFIYTLAQFDRMEEDIIKTCNTHNCRAYFRINKRSMKKTAFQMLKRVTDLIISENYKAIKNAYSAVSGEFHGDEDKKWIVDIDYKDFEETYSLISTIHTDIRMFQEETGREPMMKIIPTKNGYHIITRPFNLKAFMDRGYPNIDVHKDNPTILYCP
jgi:hypothetical protein